TLRGALVHEPVECVLRILVQARGIHVNRLDLALGLDAQQSVSRGLRLAGGDCQLLAEDVVEQGRLAHVGSADDGNIAAARRGISHCCFSTPMAIRACLAASCSAMRRLLPTPKVLPVINSIRHSTRNVRQCASPLTSTTSYCGNSLCCPCRYSCSRVFGSLLLSTRVSPWI